MGQWFANKILIYLQGKEGCTVEDFMDYTINTGLEATVRDSLGYRYRIIVEPLGRTFEDRKINPDKNSKLDFSEVV